MQVGGGVKARLLAGALVLIAGTVPGAHATEQLPVIVTFELQKQRQTVNAERRDPRTFWISQVMTRIEDRRTDAPVSLRASATTQVAFTVAHDGHLVSSAVRTTSGNPDVDKLALGMVKEAQPFPPMPDTLADPTMSFVLPVRIR